MIIGVPKEIKAQEDRVGLTPAAVHSIVQQGHDVVVQSGAGIGAGYLDDEFAAEGAHLAPDATAVYAQADLICKVKEPQHEEVSLLKRGQILFCYLHLAPLPELTQGLLTAGANAVALETIQLDDGYLPCLVPMSEIAGRMSVQTAARLLEREFGGSGILLSGATGVEPANLVILGAGCAGANAARIALGMGAKVTVLDVDMRKLAHLDEISGGRMRTLASNEYTLRKEVRNADVLIGAVLIPGAAAPKLVTEDMIAGMRPGSVVIDIAVDQGGCVATCKPTTHADPIYKVHGVTHYCVANIPGAVPRTSTQALTNATLPWLQRLAALGLENAIRESTPLRRGLNTYLPPGQSRAVLACEAVAVAQGLPWQQPEI